MPPLPSSAPDSVEAHHAIVIKAIPPWLGNASPLKRSALAAHSPVIPDWYRTLSSEQHEQLKRLNGEAWTTQNQLDKAFARLKSPETFGAELLEPALQRQYALDADVRSTWLQLYLPLKIVGIRVTPGASRTWSVSLLGAALHNFELAEAEPHAYEQHSGFSTQPSAAGHFESLPSVAAKITVAQFAKLCRDLDIGARYQRYLEDYLDQANPVARIALQHKVEQSLACALRLALYMALLKGDVPRSGYDAVHALLDNGNGRPRLKCHELMIMSSRLTGIVLFAEDLESSREVQPVIAYIPDDPEHPLKQYASVDAFLRSLVKRLRSASYQQFFSRFVGHADLGQFFAQLNSRLVEVTWHRHTPGDPLPSWRATPVDRPRLQFRGVPLKQPLFEHLYQMKLSKLLDDARSQAVSTASVDRKARWERWDLLQKIGSALLQVAALIATPFVPPLGLLMLGYTTYQLLDETFEGVIDWAEGLTREAAEHTLGFMEQLIQLGLFASGVPIAQGLLRKVLPGKSLGFFDGLKPVTTPDGNARLWKPDLTPYRQPVTPPKALRPDGQGLYRYSGNTLIRVGDDYFSVRQHPVSQRYTVQHPTRPAAYQPAVLTNGQGAWVTELERPLSWDRTTLMRRLGYQAESLSEARLQQAQRISGTHDNALRAMHMTQQPPPPLLADTLKRFKIDQALQDFIAQLNSDDPTVYAQADTQTQLQLLTSYGLWPESKTLRILDASGKAQWEFPGRAGAGVVQIHEAQLKNDDLLLTLLESLDEPERKFLLEEPANMPAPPAHHRAGVLRKKIARIAYDKRATLFDSRYRSAEYAQNASLQKIIDAAPGTGLPTCVAEELLAGASGEEWRSIDQAQVPRRIVEQAAAALLEVRTTRAYEGLYLDAVDNPDTHQLTLLSLERLPGWSGNLRLELRQYRVDGPLLVAIGAEDALMTRTVVHTETGRYRPEDEKGPVFGETDFYTAILQAIPDSQRDALDIHIGQGERLRQAIGEYALDRNRLRALLAADVAGEPAYDPSVMRLRGGMDGYPAHGPAQAAGEGPSLEDRARHLLPSLPGTQISQLIQALEARPGGALANLIALQNEYNQMDLDLAHWEAVLSPAESSSRLPLTAQEYQYALRNRALWAQQLRRGWRQETQVDDYYAQRSLNGYKLELTMPIQGELPRLTARFEHITLLELKGRHSALEIDDFLQLFPRLRHLAIRQFSLGRLAPSIPRMPHLNALILSDCNITLDQPSRAALEAMSRLVALDLYNNPLGLIPSVANMPHLRHLDLSHCGIANLPAGVMSRPHLELAMLSGNRFSELPPELFDLSADTSRKFDLSGNPLSHATLEQVKVYFQTTSGHFEIDAPQADIAKARQLFPEFTDEDINQFIFGLPGDLDAGKAAMNQLEVEYLQIAQDLLPWTEDENVTAQQRSYRSLFAQTLEAGWRRESELDAHARTNAPRFNLSFHLPISGELPTLITPFNHISSMTLSGNGSTLKLAQFLRSFPALERLSIARCGLGEFPMSLTELGQLTHLRLDGCAIELTTASVNALSGLTNLRYLDLSNNRLALIPDFDRLPGLATISLSNTGLREIPITLLSASTARARIDLSRNAITHIPDLGFELPATSSAAFDLSGNPLSRQTLQRLKTYCQATAEHWNADAPAAQLQQIKALYPTLDTSEAARLYYQLPGDLDSAAAETDGLGNEYEQLETDLHAWAMNVPARDPLLDTVLDHDSRAQEQIRRLHFKDLLQRCWRRETELADSDSVTRRGYKLEFHTQLLGDMPTLNARFNHVSMLELIGEGTNQQIDGLLRCFPNLTHLTVERHALNDIPWSVFSLSHLRHLSLCENMIRLTPQSNEQLSRLTNLRFLDLSDNPLTLAPDLRHQRRLISVYLHNCGLTETPEGVFSLAHLRILELSDNEIVHLPSDLLEMPLPLNDESDLSGNPLSAQSIALLRDYYRQTGYELGVEEAMFDEDGVELATPGSPRPMEE